MVGLMAPGSASTSILLLLIPKPKSTQERVGVVAHAATGRRLVQFLDVASPKDHFIGFQGGVEAGHHIRNMTTPFSFAVFLQSPHSDVILVGSLLVREMAQL